MPYCSQSDLFSFGVPRGATPNPGRVLASALSSTCALDVHDFSNGDPILFSPAGAGTMPAGLSSGVTYYAQAESDHTFKVRATPTGAAISFSDAADPIMVVSPLSKDDAIAWADALVDNMLPAHVVPITGAIPPLVRMTSAELAAWKLQGVNGASSKSLSEIVDAATKRLERWGKGVPLRGPDAPPVDNLAASSSSARPDPRGWKQWGGL